MRSALLLPVFVVVGCSSAPEEVTSTAAGVRKGDTIVMPGTQQTPPGVDPAKSYATSRNISIVRSLGMPSKDEVFVMERADSIAEGNKDWRVSVDELAVLASPKYIVALSPAEREALRTVWRFMVAPELQTKTVTMPEFIRPVTSLTPVVRLPTPTMITRPPEQTRFTLDEVNEVGGDAAKRAAQRIQHGFNDDNDITTVSLNDIASTSLSPAFTAAERDSFQELERKMKDWARRKADAIRDATPKTMTYGEIELTPPAGTLESFITLPDGLSLELRRENRYVEGFNESDIKSTRFSYEQRFSYRLVHANGGGLLEIFDENEGGYSGSTAMLEFYHSPVYEVWVDQVPAMRIKLVPNGFPNASQVHVDLSKFLGYRATVEGVPMHSFPVSRSNGEVIFTLSPLRPEYVFLTDEQIKAIRNRTNHAVVPGTYAHALADGTPVQLDVYAPTVTGAVTGAMVVRISGEAYPLKLEYERRRAAQVGDREIVVIGDTVYVTKDGATELFGLKLETRVAW